MSIMKTRNYFFLVLLFVMLFSCEDDKSFFENTSSNQLVTRAMSSNGILLYQHPFNTVSTNYSVKINNNDYSIYQFPDGWDTRSYCQFQTYHYRPEIINFGINDNVSATVIIKPKPGVAINSFLVRPKMRNGSLLNYTASKGSDGSIILTIKGPQSLCVEINGDCLTPILVFANKIETSPSCTYCFEEGKVYNNVDLTLTSNQTVYIAGGAIVEGKIKSAVGASNVHVKGNGIITGRMTTKSLVDFRNATNSSVEGVILAESSAWTLPLYGCSGITIDGVKIVTNNTTSDGIDIIGSNNVTVKNCFILTKDDCISIKSGVNYNWDSDREHMNVKKPVYAIRIYDCTIFNGIDGNALAIGAELNENVSDVVFENMDVIHALSPCSQDEGALSINNHGNYTVSDIVFRNIWLDNVQRYFLNIKVDKSNYSPGGSEYQYGSAIYSPGVVKNITYENIFLNKDDALHSVVKSISGVNRIQNIKFSNFYINNVKINSYVEYNNTNLYLNKFVLVVDEYSRSQLFFQ